MKDLKVAVVQASSVLFNLEATMDKTRTYIEKAAQKNAQLVLFPEAFIGGYPRGLSFGTVTGSRSQQGREMWLDYYNSSIAIPGKETELLCEWAKEYSIYIAMGVIEQEQGTLYCTLLYITPEGKIDGKHRKIKPTGFERVIWGEGDGSTLISNKTPLGTVGGLICWENYMPLARMAMYSMGVEIYLAPTADARDTWQSTMQHIALEGRCYVLGANQFVTKNDYPNDLMDQLKAEPEIMSKGGSVIISPMGQVISGPSLNKEDVIFADLKADELIKSRMDFDVTGHYHRPDIFDFSFQ